MPCLVFWKFVLCIFSLSSATAKLLPDGRPHANMVRTPGVPLVRIPAPDAPVISRNGTVLPPYNTLYEFDQLIDHRNPSLGTFKQRYWHTYEFYEPGIYYHALLKMLETYWSVGGPIILFTPGETNAGGKHRSLSLQSFLSLILIFRIHWVFD